MKLCNALVHSAPVLVYKTNTKGSFLTYVDQSSAPLKVIVELQPTSRHMIDYLKGLLRPRKDVLALAVCRAYEAPGVVKASASRLMTSFHVQASLNGLSPLKRLFQHGPEAALPQGVVEDDIDILAVQAPRCKELSPCVVDLLSSVPASLLLFPSDHAALASLGSLDQSQLDHPFLEHADLLPLNEGSVVGTGRMHVLPVLPEKKEVAAHH